jgi:hypothetical protein
MSRTTEKLRDTQPRYIPADIEALRRELMARFHAGQHRPKQGNSGSNKQPPMFSAGK